MAPVPSTSATSEAGRARFRHKLLQRHKSGRSQCIRLGLARNPTLILHWPPSRRNKFQVLLYSKALAFGYIPFPLFDLDLLDDLEWQGDIVFHAHWFSRLHKDCATEAEALAANECTFERLNAFRVRTGAKLLWTAHNVLPHETGHLYAAVDARRRVLREFDAIHLMAEEHRSILEEAFGVTLGRHMVVPHMTYEGVYPDNISRDQARRALGIRPEDFVFGSFGSLQPYKGIEKLIITFRELAGERPNSRLLIAGAPVDLTYAEALVRLWERDPRIILHAHDVQDRLVEAYFKASDVMVFPYDETLNSGAAATALTFGVPIIGSDTTAFRNLGSPLVRRFRDKPGSRLGDAMRQAMDMAAESHAHGPGAFRPDIDHLHPDRISTQFFIQLEELFSQRQQTCSAS